MFEETKRVAEEHMEKGRRGPHLKQQSSQKEVATSTFQSHGGK